MERGLTPETIQHFRLGYIDSPIFGDNDYKGYLTIPYITISGIVSIRLKRVKKTGPKMLAYHDSSSKRPYNVRALYRSDPLFLVEGEPDTWAAHQAGLNVLGIPGVSGFLPAYKRLLRFRPLSQGGSGVTMLEQGDTEILKGSDPPRTPAQLLTETVQEAIPGVMVIRMPPGEDVNSILLTSGAQRIREMTGLSSD